MLGDCHGIFGYLIAKWMYYSYFSDCNYNHVLLAGFILGNLPDIDVALAPFLGGFQNFS